ncbi:MAG: endonuclease I [Parvicellaceae bacterium]|jgi:endonuclease I
MALHCVKVINPYHSFQNLTEIEAVFTLTNNLTICFNRITYFVGLPLFLLMKYSLFLVVFGLSFCGFAQIPPGYYDLAAGKTGETLRTSLKGIIDAHTVYSYSDLWTHFSSTDNNSGLVWDMYSDVPSGTPSYTYAFGTDQCGSYSAEGDCYNREHSVPQSWFGSASPMYSDLFHIYPTDGFVNGQRGSFPFGEVGSATSTTSNGSKVGPSNFPGYSGTVFEPIDEYKGDFARTYFYMMTRYKGSISGWSSDMFTSDNLSSWAENLLLSWSLADPVSAKETARNNAIYWIQGNRNPFIDDPTWIESIWGPTAAIMELYTPKVSAFVNGNVMTINNFKNEDMTLEIYNLVGELILSNQIVNGISTRSVNFPKGLYIASFRSENYTLKFTL